MTVYFVYIYITILLKMPSWKNSMLSQIVMLTIATIVAMQIYYFYKTQQILELFNTLASMVIWWYLSKRLWDSKPE